MNKGKAVKSGPSSLRSKNPAGNRIQQTVETLAGPSRPSVGGKRVKNERLAGLDEQ
jgi:hypothetical protein